MLSNTPLLDMGEILLLCGLAAKEPGEHGLAVDITIQAISDGRLGTDNMDRMLTTGITSGHFNLSRLAKRLHDIANASDLHAYVLMHSAESAFPNADAQQLPRGIGDIFQLLAEIGKRVSNTRNYLKDFKKEDPEFDPDEEIFNHSVMKTYSKEPTPRQVGDKGWLDQPQPIRTDMESAGKGQEKMLGEVEFIEVEIDSD